MPWVTFSLSSGLEENMTPTRSQRYVYLVKGVASSLMAAGALQDAIDDLLHGTTLTVTGSTMFHSSRITVVRYQERDSGDHVIGHAGGEYAFGLEDA